MSGSIVMVSIHGVTEHAKILGNTIAISACGGPKFYYRSRKCCSQFFRMFGGPCMLTIATP